MSCDRLSKDTLNTYPPRKYCCHSKSASPFALAMDKGTCYDQFGRNPPEVARARQKNDSSVFLGFIFHCRKMLVFLQNKAPGCRERWGAPAACGVVRGPDGRGRVWTPLRSRPRPPLSPPPRSGTPSGSWRCSSGGRPSWSPALCPAPTPPSSTTYVQDPPVPSVQMRL